MDLAEVRELHARKAGLERETLGIWRDEKGRTIDDLICPVAPHPVPEIDRWNGVGYTSAFVLLDYAAGTLPVRDFAEGVLKEELSSDSEVLGGWDARNRDLCKLCIFLLLFPSLVFFSCSLLSLLSYLLFPLPFNCESTAKS